MLLVSVVAVEREEEEEEGEKEEEEGEEELSRGDRAQAWVQTPSAPFA